MYDSTIMIIDSALLSFEKITYDEDSSLLLNSLIRRLLHAVIFYVHQYLLKYFTSDVGAKSAKILFYKADFV